MYFLCKEVELNENVIYILNQIYNSNNKFYLIISQDSNVKVSISSYSNREGSSLYTSNFIGIFSRATKNRKGKSLYNLTYECS